MAYDVLEGTSYSSCMNVQSFVLLPYAWKIQTMLDFLLFLLFSVIYVSLVSYEVYFSVTSYFLYGWLYLFKLSSAPSSFERQFRNELPLLYKYLREARTGEVCNHARSRLMVLRLLHYNIFYDHRMLISTPLDLYPRYIAQVFIVYCYFRHSGPIII